MTRALMNPDKPRAVYRHFNSDGKLLYVGCSAAPITRQSGHQSASPWFAQVSRIEIEWFPNAVAAMDRELELIKTLRPPFNRSKRGAREKTPEEAV